MTRQEQARLMQRYNEIEDELTDSLFGSGAIISTSKSSTYFSSTKNRTYLMSG
jgi:hypothetical protein